MGVLYKESKIMSNSINIDVGIDGDKIALERTSINFRNFRNLLSDGVITLDDTSLCIADIDEELAMALFNSLLAIYESDAHINKLKIDSKLQDGEVTKSE